MRNMQIILFLYEKKTYFINTMNNYHLNRPYHISQQALCFNSVCCYAFASSPDTQKTNKMQHKVEYNKGNKVS